jgi:ABC-2 type transport system ATP-binding protein
MNAIEVTNLTKNFKNFQLNDISFSLPKGYIMGLIGANGAGKTTLIKLLMGLYLKDSGEISVLGCNPYDNFAIKDQIGFVYDNPKFYDFNLKKIIKIINPFYSTWDQDLCDYYMKLFNLNYKMRFKTLSRGMQLKFSLTIALSHHAKLLILDEPTSGLDPIFRNEFLAILQDVIVDGEKSILFSSHITTDVEKIADYITYIKDGEILFSNDCNDIMNSFVLINGSEEQIPAAIKDIMIGGQVNKYNYEALIPAQHNLDCVWSNEEIPNLEQIMYYHERGDNYVAIDH